MYLNKLMPLEGGLYQWAKLGFNEAVGFMLAWNLWLYVIVNTSEIGLQCATYLAYALGPTAAWLTKSTWFVAVATVVVLSLMVVVSTIGLSVGKWVHNAGGIMMLIVFGALLILPVISLLTGHLRAYHPLRTSVPAFSLYNLNILGKLGFGALGGFEYVAILAGETKAPARSIGRSVMIAVPVIALMFVLGTSTVVALLSVVGVGQAEAFQLINKAGGMFYALGYIVLVVIPLFGLPGVRRQAPAWLRVLSLSGLLMTVLYVTLSVFPIIKVESVTTFALKISLV